MCETDNGYPFPCAADAGCCTSGAGAGIDTGADFGGCEDLEQFEKASKRLKTVLRQICMLKSIFDQMRKEFVEKMNIFGACDAECYLHCSDIDFQNKLMFVLFKQIESLVTQNNCVFNGTKNAQQIKVYMNSGKSLMACIIDNVKFTLITDCNKKYILVNIGCRQYKLWFLGDCTTNSNAICILQQNCCTINLILSAFMSNTKMITQWLSVSKNMSKCMVDCDDKKDCSCDSKRC